MPTELFPPVDPDRIELTAPIAEVTLLEDRAVVRRAGRIGLPGSGRHRLVLHDVSPVLQDVSLRVEVLSGPAAVADARARRALRARQEEKVEAVQALEQEVRALREALAAAADDQRRAEERYRATARMLVQGASELPQDVAWGLVSGEAWSETFGTLFTRARTLRAEATQHHHDQIRLADDLHAALRRLHDLKRRALDTVAWIEIDLVANGQAEVALEVTYTAANALWRPLHRAELREGRLRFVGMGAIWQQTGEDWRGVQVSCSTARASLGIEPPLLSDDLLRAQRKAEQVRLQARQVAVQQTGPHDPAAALPSEPAGVELPGVDDGGEVQHLRAMRPADVPSDGRLVTVPLFTFTAEAEVEHVLIPTVEEQVHLRSTQRNTGTMPILAGPVELVRDSGALGWGEVLFVAPGARFVLGFGPQDELRVHYEEKSKEKVDEIEKWTHRDVTEILTLSNIGAEARVVHVTQRVPVSEVEEVRVTIDEKRSTAGLSFDAHTGFCRWSHVVPGNHSEVITLRWRLSVAPGISASSLL